MIQCKTSKAISGMGHSMKRKEDARFLQGKGHYVDDIKLPGMLYMDIVRSPYAYAKIKSINIEEAMKVPGVVAVVTAATLKSITFTGCRPSCRIPRWYSPQIRSCTRHRKYVPL